MIKTPEKSLIEWYDLESLSKVLTEKAKVNEFDNYVEPDFKLTDKIYFSDDVWDFRKEKTFYRKGVYYYDFSEVRTTIYRIFLKRFVLRQLFEVENRYNSVKGDFMVCKKFILFLENDCFILNPKLVYARLLNEYFRKHHPNITERSKTTKVNPLTGLFSEFENEIPGFPINEFKFELNKIDKRLVNAAIESGKTPNIPKPIRTRITQVALADIDNKELDLTQRMIACLILIIGQSGMRFGEARILETNKLLEISILNGQKKAYSLEFFTYKTSSNKDGKWTICSADEILVKAYQTLDKLTKDRRVKTNSKYLYVNKNGNLYFETSIRTHYELFFIRHQEELAFDTLDEYGKTQIIEFVVREDEVWRHRQLKKEDLGKVLYKINPHQFRVAVANELKEQGVTLQWIKAHMNHMSEDMTIHYFRNDTLMRETLMFRASADGSKLEMNPNKAKGEVSKELNEPELIKAYEEINKFLKKKRLNIFKNIDQIINIFKTSPVVESGVGLCTKAFGTLCERQERLATLEKWYYVRPQIADVRTFDFTYRRFIDKVKLVLHNQKVAKENPTYERQYNIELNSLKKFYKNKFLPEYKMLNDEINEKGLNEVINLYPDLKIKKVEDFRKEIQQWIMKIGLEN
jgi:integrase